jgi:hypothetical protein
MRSALARMFAGSTSACTLPLRERVRDSMNATVSGCAGPRVGGASLWAVTSWRVMKLLLPVAINQQRLMQLEAMVLPDR